MTNSKYGAGHDFSPKKKPKISFPVIKGEMKVSKTVYIKMKFLDYVLEKMPDMSMNEALNELLQCGIAHKMRNEEDKLLKTLSTTKKESELWQEK